MKNEVIKNITDKAVVTNIPNLTKPFIDWLDNQTTKDKLIVEFGAGGSTMYFSEKFAHVFSFEHDDSWIQQVNNKKLNNVYINKLHNNIFEDSNIISLMRNADYILIDNDPNYITRGFIASMVFEKCKTKAKIILDNVEGHEEAYLYLKSMFNNKQDFYGKNNLNQLTTTSIFYESL